MGSTAASSSPPCTAASCLLHSSRQWKESEADNRKTTKAAASATMAARWHIGLLILGAAVSCVLASTDIKPRMVGVPVDLDFENDADAKTALNYAINQYNMASNDKFSSKVSKVHSVTRQLVAGVKYVITAEIARTTCTKSTFNSASCAFNEASDMSKPLLCKFEVLVTPWTKKSNLLKHDCQ